MHPFARQSTFGADLRSLRKARGLTLQTVAASIDRSVGWLSQVERDLSYPNADELRALARILDVAQSLFFGQSLAAPQDAGRIVRADLRRRIGTHETGLIEELLSPDLTDDFEMIRSEFLPGAEQHQPVKRPTQEVAYLISGELQLWLEEQHYSIHAGDSFRIRGESYRWANYGTEKAVAIWVIAPPVY